MNFDDMMHEFSKRFKKKPDKPKASPVPNLTKAQELGLTKTLQHHQNITGMSPSNIRQRGGTKGGIIPGASIPLDSLVTKPKKKDGGEASEFGDHEFHGYGKAYQGNRERLVSPEESREYDRSGYLPYRLSKFLPKGSQGRTNYRTKREKWKTEQGMTRGKWEVMPKPQEDPTQGERGPLGQHKGRSRPRVRLDQRGRNIIPHSEFGDTMHEFVNRSTRNAQRMGSALREGARRAGVNPAARDSTHRYYEDYSDAKTDAAEMVRRQNRPSFGPLRGRPKGHNITGISARLVRKAMEKKGMLPNIQRGQASEFGDHEFGGRFPEKYPSSSHRRKGGISRWVQEQDTATGGRGESGQVRGPGRRGSLSDSEVTKRAKILKGRGFHTQSEFGDQHEFSGGKRRIRNKKRLQALHKEVQARTTRDRYAVARDWGEAEDAANKAKSKGIAKKGRSSNAPPISPSARVVRKELTGGGHLPVRTSEFGETMRNFGDDQFLLFFANEYPEAFQEVASEFHDFASEPDYRWGRPRGKGHPEDRPGDQPIKSLPSRVSRGRGGSRGPYDVKHGSLSAEQRRHIAEAGEKNRANIEERKRRGTYSSEFNDFSLQEFKNKRKVAVGKKMLRFLENMQFQKNIQNAGETELFNRMKATGNEKDFPKAILEKFSYTD